MLTQRDKDKIALVEWALKSIYIQEPEIMDDFVKITAIQIPVDQDAAPVVIVKEGFDDLARALEVKIQDFYGIKGRYRGFYFAGQAVKFLEGEVDTIVNDK